MSVESALDNLRDGTVAALARAVAELTAEARAGAPEAPRYLATLAAAGVGLPQSWARALSSLFAAALAGSDFARGQLTVLSGSPPPTAAQLGDPNYWRRLCAAVRIEDWLKPCEKRILSTSPDAMAIEGFLPDHVCAWIVGRAAGRSAETWTFDIVDSDVVLQLTRQRIAATLGVTVAGLIDSRLLRHAAAPDGGAVGFLVYLDDGADGGGARFAGQDVEHRSRAGDAFYSAAPDSDAAGDGTGKWVFSQRFRDRACV